MKATRPEPALLDLPWELPLEQWTEHVVPVPRGLSRHVVRVIGLGAAFYAIKETQGEIAQHEYELLRRLNRLGLPVVHPQAVVLDRPTDPDAALVTRHLGFALSYRTVFVNGLPPEGTPTVIDALVVLLVRLHLAGFYWGDVSLSNALFRRSAGEFAAYLVDAETGELHDSVPDRLREHDLEVGCENVFAELLDLEAAGYLEGVDAHAVVDRIGTRYQALWDELLAPEQFSSEDMWRLEQRIRRLGDLGFDVEEIDISTDPGHHSVRIQPRVVEAGHHARELEELTGLVVEDNQARRLLGDLAAYMAHFGLTDRKAAAARWRSTVYDRIEQMIPVELRGRLEMPEVFHQVLEHRWLRSEAAGHELDLFDVTDDYIESVLRRRPDERLSASSADDENHEDDRAGQDAVYDADETGAGDEA